MSQDNIEEEEADVSLSCCCASCGKAEIDHIKLVPCDDCDLVKYCSDECQEDHRSQHEEACKKRAAELRDELLFKQPESSHLGDCPICCLPIPLDKSKSTLKSCCSKIICNGCWYANQIREQEARLVQSCPFCRKRAPPKTEEEYYKLLMKRVKANDPVAMRREGGKQYDKGDYSSAFEYWTKAAAFGDAEAHCRLARFSVEGQGVEKDEGMAIHHAEEAAIGGHPVARHNLGGHEMDYNDNAERAMKHWVIAATQGHDESIKMLMDTYKKGLAKKDDFGAALRAHKAAVDATKSPQREVADEFYRYWDSISL